MSTYEFKENDIIFNVMETHPRCDFIIYSGNVYYNKFQNVSGAFAANILGVPNGNISLYELNVDRTATATELIYPFITKDGSLTSFRTTTTKSFNTDFSYGDTLTGSYPMSASITREHFTSTTRAHVTALKNVLNYHSRLSPQYAYTSSFGDKATQTLSLISIPSIFYGASIKKGSVDMQFYVTGSLVGQLKDENKNGELIQVGPSGSTKSGSCAGVVLYDEGFVLLTGSWALDGNSIDYLADATDKQNSKWIYFGVGANDGITTAASASYVFNFKGTEKIPTLTMFARAPKGELNFSNNPTFTRFSSSNTAGSFLSSSNQYIEQTRDIKNTISSSYPDPNAAFKRQVFITKVAIYDEDKNLIGIASVANPVKKTVEDDYTFKLKLDL